LRTLYLAGLSQRSAEWGQDLHATTIVRRQQCGRSFEEAHRRPRVAAPAHAPGGRSELFRSSAPEEPRPFVHRPERLERAVRLLEVVADDLVELLAPAREPLREALVQLGSELFRDPFVRGVSDQPVAEAERVLDRLMRLDQVLSDERRQAGTGRPVAVRGERCQRLPLELRPDHGRAFEHVALLLGQAVEAGGEERMNRGRQALGLALFAQDREQLLHEQRVSFGGLADPCADLILELRPGDEPLDQLV
jgi:hypothetical protein